MTTREQVVQQMLDAGLPSLPDGHPKLDGKFQRFGKQKKCWYVLREITLRSGLLVVTGAFGRFQGEDRGTIPVRIESEAMSEEDRAEIRRKHAEAEQREAEELKRQHHLAANRAKDQWSKASTLPSGMSHPYLAKKQVPNCGLKLGDGGLLLIPMRSKGGLGDLAGLQKISDDGEKKYNQGMNKQGAAFRIECTSARPELANLEAIGEGYATCASAHVAIGMAVTVAYDAGNIIHVARALRAAHPKKHLLFLADDDYLLEKRFIAMLDSRFSVTDVAGIQIDGGISIVKNSDGEDVSVSAQWLKDDSGIPYILADVRCGRQVATIPFKNAGVSCCTAAAKEVGNASVVYPVFESRGVEKLTDFNDLQVVQSIDAVASQINAAIARAFAPVDIEPDASETTDTFLQAAQQLHDNSSPFDEDALFDQAVSVVVKNQRASISLVQRHLRIGYNRAARLLEMMEKAGVVSAMDSSGFRSVASVSPAPPSKELEPPRQAEDASPMKPEDQGEEFGLRDLSWALEHCSLIIGSTDVWDSFNNIRSKKSAFIGLIGKANFKEWEVHSDRKSIKMGVQGVVASAAAPAAGGEGSGAASKKKATKEYGDSHWEKVDRLLNNFTLIYGVDEIWDGERRMLIKVNPLRLAFGNDAVKYWLNNSDRRMVPVNRVVFDPTQTADSETTVNLFNGISMVPKAGDPSEYNLILELLRYLCGTDEIYEWVLCWLAYAIQNPGAKMVTSIIMHGDEGSGKNLFFEKCIAQIYGEYGGVIGNAEIESQFNEWASKKLFVVCDEVVTRSELRQLKGRLKAMVSNPTININPKNLTSRVEANHMNFVFLSNELQPLALDKTDRRYMVIWTPPKQTEAYYTAVKDQMAKGGNEAFYHFLLNLDVGDFNAHTKPIMTQAKQDLIELGLSPPERFFNEWEAGLLPLPYVCCSAMQLYSAFCRWSYLNGERFPPTQTLFGRTISRIAFGKITKGAVQYELMSDVKQRTVYLVGDKPEDRSREKWVEDGSNLFEKALQKYRHVFASDDPLDS